MVPDIQSDQKLDKQNGFSVQGAGIKTVAGNRRIIGPDPRMYGMNNYDDVSADTLEKG